MKAMTDVQALHRDVSSLRKRVDEIARALTKTSENVRAYASQQHRLEGTIHSLNNANAVHKKEKETLKKRARVLEAAAAGQWIPTARLMPEDGAYVLVMGIETPHRVVSAYREGGEWLSEIPDDGIYTDWFVSHWTPIPTVK